MKKQVFELLSALCVYNAEGYSRALEALDHYKVTELKQQKLGRNLKSIWLTCYTFSSYKRSFKNVIIVLMINSPASIVSSDMIYISDFQDSALQVQHCC